MKTPTRTTNNETAAALGRDAPRLHSLEASSRKQFGAHSVPRASAASAAARSAPAPKTHTLNQRGGAFARHLNQAATGPARSHHSPHQQPKWPFWERIRPAYEGLELAPYTGRPGAMDAMALPSRMGNRLHYRDGRVDNIGD